MDKEQKFYAALKDVFVGAKIEGESGFINLMKIKSAYFEKVFAHLKKDVDESLKKFPEFREELFDKLYTFFNRYFSESGSIYFSYTPIHQNVYEKVYTDDKDVMLFWKTNMLYYVKTDRIFKNLEVEEGGFKFFFDVSKLEYKKANEKRDIIYEFKERRKDGTLVFNVYYSEKGKITKLDEIMKELRKEKINIEEETLEATFRIFEKQNEVDYFINKNAKEFLKEQLNIWLYQYVFTGESEWTETRIKQLQTLKSLANKIIDFISQFEDELIKIWNKPKFVLNSNYVITLDRIADRNAEFVKKILNHKTFSEQLKEWKELGIVDKNFDKGEVIKRNSTGIVLNKEYGYLPVDTIYFKDLEPQILELFDELDESLDGWLIRSENYQALNTILPKFKGRIKCVYIDPPYNTGSDEFIYRDKFRHSSWLTMMDNRLNMAKRLMRGDGAIFVSIDERERNKLSLLMHNIFGAENRIAEVTVKVKDPAGVGQQSIIFDICEYLLGYASGLKALKEWLPANPEELEEVKEPIEGYKHWLKTIGTPQLVEEIERPQVGRIKIFKCKGYEILNAKQMDFNEYLKKTANIFADYNPSGGMILAIRHRIPEEGLSYIEYTPTRGENAGKLTKVYFLNRRILASLDRILVKRKSRIYRRTVMSNLWSVANASLHSEGGVSLTSGKKPEELILKIVKWFSKERDIVLDFFIGSGTTCGVSQKTGRRWIGIDFEKETFNLALTRCKKALAGEQSAISKEVDWNGGGFFKYYELEQYEDTLRRVKYEDSGLFQNPNEDPYNQYVFMRDVKMLDALEIDYKNNKVRVDLSKLYKNVDVAETLSNLLGRQIKRITPDFVEFDNGDRIAFKDLDYKLIKPLVWW